MVICRYFLRGSCRFGNYCKYEHTREGIPEPLLRRQDFVTIVNNDIDKAIKGKQWLLSSYGPFSEKPSFPGFEDKSFEEVRWEFYQAINNGNVEQVKRQFLHELEVVKKKLLTLRTLPDSAIRILQEISGNATIQVANVFNNRTHQAEVNTYTSQSVIKDSAANFSFLAAANSGNVFGKTSSQSSSPMFANQQSTNIFGGSFTPQQTFANTAPAQSPFQSSFISGSGSGGNLFAQSSPASHSVFQTPAPQNMFGQNVTPSQNIFAQNNQIPHNIFGGPALPSQNIFGGRATTSQNIFAQNNSTPQNIFSQNSTSQNVFGQSQTSQNIFGQSSSNQPAFNQNGTNEQNIFHQNTQNIFQPNSQNIFNQTKSTHEFQHNSPFLTSQTPGFGMNTNTFSQQNLFGQNTEQKVLADGDISNHTNKVFDETIYSKLSDLTDNEIACFKNAIFEFGKIPISPPAIELC